MKSKKKKKKKIDIEAATADLQEIALKQNDEVGAPEKETINQEDKNDNELVSNTKKETQLFNHEKSKIPFSYMLCLFCERAYRGTNHEESFG